MKNKSIRGIVFLLLFFCLLTLNSSGFAATDEINWQPYNKGTQLGKKEEKKIFLHFWADWCGYCIKMAKETFTKPAVISYLNENFIAIKVDFDRESKIATLHNVRGLPANLFIAEDGENISNLPGFIPADMLVNILKYVNSGSYKDMTLSKFLKEL
jgi:thioredoxin-related protein